MCCSAPAYYTCSMSIVAQPTQGYLMVSEMSRPPHDGHVLCGDQTFAGAVSPNSGRRLLQLSQISTADQRLELDAANFEVLPLLYSWTCDIHQGTFSYAVGRGKIDVLDFRRGQAYTHFTKTILTRFRRCSWACLRSTQVTSRSSCN